jgi:hypothetical protein
VSRRRRTVDYPWMNRRRPTDNPLPLVIYSCDRCGRPRGRPELLEYHDYELRHEGLGDLRDDRLGLYFVCKEGCHANQV